MARLPRHSPATSTPAVEPERAAVPLDRLAERGAPTALDARVGADAAVGERGARRDQAVAGESVQLDAAIDAMLVAGGVDAITRVRLSEARRAIAEAGLGEQSDGSEGANLSRALFRFVMPRLRHPEVLRADRHCALLEGLADGLAGGDGDGIAREGALVIHRELRRLALLRTARNALVEG